MRDPESRSGLDAFIDFCLSLISPILAILLVAAVLFVGGWFVNVPFGHKTTSQYLHWLEYLVKHPQSTAAGQWIDDMLHRIKS